MFSLALKKCELYTARTYDYTTYYSLSNISSNTKSDEYYIDFLTYVIAKKDVHILLAETPTDTRSSYEIGE